MKIRKCAVLLAGLLLGVFAGFNCAGQTNEAGQSNQVVHSSNSNYVARVRASAHQNGKIGDDALPLYVQEWIKGKPVKIRPGTNVYAIVFCTLSRAGEFALTNLSALQTKYQDQGLRTVVVSDDSPDQLKDFVQVHGADINFTVAADGLARKTANNYEITFNQRTHIQAYVVGKDGKVLWFGHPLREGMGEVVDQALSGHYDMVQTKKMMLRNQMMDGYLAMARMDDPQTAKAGWIMLAVRTNDAPALCDLAFQIATDQFIGTRDTSLANRALDRAEQLATTNAADIAVDRALLLFQDGKQEEGLAKARQALSTVKTDEDKNEVNACIRAMEARLASEKTNPPAAGTNVPPTKP